MEGLAGVAMDEGLPSGASDFGDLDERAMNLLAKIDKGQKAVQNEDYLKAFDYYVSARRDALTGSAVDDAPTYPTLNTPLSPINADLLYSINSAGDEDTFIFTTTVTGNVQISLTNLPANYDLYVYSPTQQEPIGTSIQAGTASETVSLVNAAPGVYFVQVVPVNNDTWDLNNPYTLRFDAPNEPTPTPTPTATPTPTPTPTPIPFTFTGFFAPVDNLPTLNTVKAGQAIPVKFSLGGDYGLNIFMPGYPSSSLVACGTTAEDAIEETSTAGSSSLSYDSGSGRYHYVWKTDKAWANTCRTLVLKFTDGTIRKANFKFK